MNNYDMEKARELIRYQNKFGTQCFDLVMNNVVDEDELYELIPYIAEYMNWTRSKEMFKDRLFIAGNIDGHAKTKGMR